MSNIKYSVDTVLLSNPFCNSYMIEDKETSMLLQCDDLICFIVGGTRFEIIKSRFAYWPQTRLSKLIRTKKENEILNLCDKYIARKETKTMMDTYMFFRNGKHFNSILDKC